MKVLLSIVGVLTAVAVAEAKLTVQVGEPKTAGSKTLIKLSLKNTFTNKVESARATVFLLNEQDKVIAQASQWLIGGTNEKAALAAGASTTYNFVVPTYKPFTKTKLIFNRIVLEGGKQVDPAKNFEIEKN